MRRSVNASAGCWSVDIRNHRESEAKRVEQVGADLLSIARGKLRAVRFLVRFLQGATRVGGKMHVETVRIAA